MSELATIKTLDREPFKNMVATIGNLPTSFVDSMSYFDMLAWLCNYIEQEVIPAVNSCGGAIEELQALYVELKEYVDNYFENLDVQEEIDHKLDEMAESGQLAEIISIYLNTNAIMAYNTVADLEDAENVVDGTFARTYGKDEYNDGKGAFYKVREVRNTDVIDGDNIVALPDDTLVAEKMPDFNIESLHEEINEVKGVIKSVKDFGAVGDGTTDDTVAIASALDSLNDGDKLYFPAGDYIVYSDYEANTDNPSYPLAKILKLVEKKNITLYGDGFNSIIRPPYQGASNDKVYFPCTLTIDRCSAIEIFGLTIESKGENYGDADAGGSVSQSDRQEFVMANGGSAILVSGSIRVNIHDCTFRYAGSCGVVYHSDVHDCIVRNCFANAASYGYAGYALDTFCYNSSELNDFVWYDGCVVRNETRVRPEDGTTVIGTTGCSGKCGICTEGVASHHCKVKISNCNLSGARSNSSNGYREGEALIIQSTDADIYDNIMFNNEGGIYLADIQTNTTPLIINASNNSMVCKWFGIEYRANGSSAVNSFNFLSNTIEVLGEIVPETAVVSVKNNPILAIFGYSTADFTFLNNITKGSKFFICATHHIGKVNIENNKIDAIKFIYSYGGGDYTIKNNVVNLSNTSTSSVNTILDVSTVDASSDLVVGYLLMDMTDNTFTTTFYKNHLNINNVRLDLITKFDVGHNKISNGYLANQAVLKDFKGMIPVVCDYKDTPTSDYSRIRFKFNGDVMPFTLPIIQDNNGTFHKCENYIAFDAASGTATYYLVNASANSAFTEDQTYMAIFHRNAS